MAAEQVAEAAEQAGVGYVLIKSGQDADFWSARYTPETVGVFSRRGLPVLAWVYVTPGDVLGTIRAVTRAAAVPGTTGVVLDVETEFEGAWRDQARAVCEGIRDRLPGIWLGYTSFGWVGFHSDFPWHTFDRYCGDGFFPQVYWSTRGISWRDGYEQAVTMAHEAGLRAPLWMVQSNENGPDGRAPSTRDLNAFFARAGPRASLWEFPHQGQMGKLAQLPVLHFR
jgi:hypothetical protein